MIRTIRYRLYPNKEQEGLFNSHISVCCWLYNTALEHRIIAFKKLGISLNCLSKSVHDAGWGMFIKMLTYKAEEAGTHVIAVNPYRTSQICSGCGSVVKKTLADREHSCPCCGLRMDRDLNAAHNILKLGTSLENTFYSTKSFI